MGEAFEKIIQFAPAYLADLMRLITGPKRFVTQPAPADQPHTKAIVFLAVSFLLSWALMATFVEKDDVLTELASDAMFTFLAVLAYGACVVLSWRLVRGRARASAFFTIHFYYAGVLVLLSTCWFMALMGLLRASDAGLHKEFIDAVRQGGIVTYVSAHLERFLASRIIAPLAVVVVLGLVSGLVWTGAMWGAYRQLNRASRLRSLMAAAAFTVLCLPMTALLFLVANAAVT